MPSQIGRSYQRKDAVAKVRGEAMYADDMKFNRLAHGKFVRSPYPHAIVKNIDTSRAASLPGVLAVITGKDIPQVEFGSMPGMVDEWALAHNKVRFVGDEVAAVAALTEEIAERACELIDVEYEVLEPVFDPEHAMDPGAPVIHDKWPNNCSVYVHKEFGDVEKGFREADHIRTDRFTTQQISHVAMEPHCCIAYWERNRVNIVAAKHAPFMFRRTFAKAMAMDEGDVRVISPTIGGAFGNKVEVFAMDVCAATLSRIIGRPVKFHLTREESITALRARHPFIIDIKTGVKKDGTITAQEWKWIADGGAHNSTAPLMLLLGSYMVMLPYRVENIKIDAYHVFTNKHVNGAMRGHGIVQVRFAADSQMDLLARDLGMDVKDLVLKNALRANEPYIAGITIRSCGFTESIEAATRGIGWDEKRGKGNGRGVGLGCSAFVCGVNNMMHQGASAIVEIHRDGGASLFTGVVEMGQGSHTALAQIAAEELGMVAEQVRVFSGDTDTSPIDPGTFGSGGVFRGGTAVRRAAIDARTKIFEAISAKLKAKPDELELKDGKIFLKENHERWIPFKEALRIIQYDDKPIPVVGVGHFISPAKEPITLLTEDGDLSGAYSFGCMAAEVEVNKKTGQVKVLKAVTGHECGKAINPMGVDGQLQGSIVTGMGQVLYEGFVHSPREGQCFNPTLMDYKIPTAMEMPDMECIDVESLDPLGPFGAKEAGEGTMVFTVPAIVNAIEDAIGVRIKDLPVTPDKILKALKEKAQAGGAR